MVSGKEKTLLLGAVLPTVACLALLLVQWQSASCRFVEHSPGSSLLTCMQHVRFVGDQVTSLLRVRRKEGLLFRRREVRGSPRQARWPVQGLTAWRNGGTAPARLGLQPAHRRLPRLCCLTCTRVPPCRSTILCWSTRGPPTRGCPWVATPPPWRERCRGRCARP